MALGIGRGDVVKLIVGMSLVGMGIAAGRTGKEPEENESLTPNTSRLRPDT